MPLFIACSVHEFGESAERGGHRVDFAFKVVAELLGSIESFEEIGFLGPALLPLFIVLEEDAIVVDVVHQRFPFVHEGGEAEVKVVADERRPIVPEPEATSRVIWLMLRRAWRPSLLKAAGRLVEVFGEGRRLSGEGDPRRG